MEDRYRQYLYRFKLDTTFDFPKYDGVPKDPGLLFLQSPPCEMLEGCKEGHLTKARTWDWRCMLCNRKEGVDDPQYLVEEKDGLAG